MLRITEINVKLLTLSVNLKNKKNDSSKVQELYGIDFCLFYQNVGSIRVT